jgi:hypothetical protein
VLISNTHSVPVTIVEKLRVFAIEEILIENKSDGKQY